MPRKKAEKACASLSEINGATTVAILKERGHALHRQLLLSALSPPQHLPPSKVLPSKANHTAGLVCVIRSVIIITLPCTMNLLCR